MLKHPSGPYKMSGRENMEDKTEAEKKANLTVDDAFVNWKLAEKRTAMAKHGHRQADIREFHARHRSEAARTSTSPHRAIVNLTYH